MKFPPLPELPNLVKQFSSPGNKERKYTPEEIERFEELLFHLNDRLANLEDMKEMYRDHIEKAKENDNFAFARYVNGLLRDTTRQSRELESWYKVIEEGVDRN